MVVGLVLFKLRVGGRRMFCTLLGYDGDLPAAR